MPLSWRRWLVWLFQSPDAINNWINDFFSGHAHCTKFQGSISKLADILATVIQGYAISPASFVVTASDLQPVHV